MIRIQLQFIKTNITQCALLFFICIFSISSIKAQESVYYLVNHHASDMFRVNTNTNIVEEIISFKDEVVIQNEAIQENIKTYLQEILNPNIVGFRINPIQKENASALDLMKSQSEISVDSIVFHGTWHRIQYSFYDDGYVGGTPNQVDEKIEVDGFGVIHSYSNFRNAHSMFMMYHQDIKKQEILIEIYKHLAKNRKNQYGIDWDKILEISEKYAFTNAVSSLENLWLQHQKNLKISLQISERIQGEVIVTTIIKNVSKQRYYFDEYSEISPVEIIVHYKNKTETKSLADTYSGYFLKRLKETIYLDIGEEIELKQKLPQKINCGGCTHITYDGFQIVNNKHNLVSWLMNNVKQFNKQQYIKYPLREIKK